MYNHYIYLSILRFSISMVAFVNLQTATCLSLLHPAVTSPCGPSLPRAGVRLRPRSGDIGPAILEQFSSCMDLTLILKISYFMKVVFGDFGEEILAAAQGQVGLQNLKDS